MSLPPPVDNQPYCSVSALEAGHLDLALATFLTTAPPDAKVRAPSLSFLLRHSHTRKTFVFDLGIRRDWENYPSNTVLWLTEASRNIGVPQNAAESLVKGGLDPSLVDTVCLSHCHYDHIGDATPFTNAQFVLGGESSCFFEPGHLSDPSPHAIPSLPRERINFLPKQSGGAVGPFPHVHDFYGDGSLYIVDAPGHLPGHLNILARTSLDGGWIYLAGDSAHHWSLITGKAQIVVPESGWCPHADKAAAEQNIARIGELSKADRVRIILAHDEPWYKINRSGSGFWPGSIESL